MTATENAETVIAGKARRDWVTVLLVALLIVLVGWITWDKAVALERVHVAEANAQTFAQEVQAACASGGALVGDYSICSRADDVADKPVTGTTTTVERGQDGARGEKGPKGDTGAASTVPGPMGSAGPFAEGADSTVPGPKGDSGEPSTVAGPEGAASTIPGPPGADSTIPGPKGETGPDGRSITSVACVDQGSRTTPVWNWVFTFTDGTTLDVSGPCKVVA